MSGLIRVKCAMAARLNIINNHIKLFFIVSVFIALFSGTVITINNNSSRQTLLDELTSNSKLYTSVYQSILQLTESNLLLTASIVIEDKQFQTLFYQGKQAVQQEGGGAGGVIAERYRNQLNELVTARWEHATGSLGLQQLHFYLWPDSTSFLRVHSPENFGDPLDDIRQLIIDTNQDKLPRSGFEIGRTYAGIRGVQPMYYTNKDSGEMIHLGVVEVGLSLDYITRTFQKQTGLDSAIILSTDQIESIMWPDVIFKQFTNIADCECLVESSTSDLPAAVLKHRERNHTNQSFVTDEVQIVQDGNKYYSTTFVVLNDYISIKKGARTPVGYFVQWQDITGTMSALKSQQNQNIGLGVLTFLILELLFILGFLLADRLGKKKARTKDEELSRSISKQSMLNYALDQVEGGMFLTNINAQLMFVNEGLSRMLGYSTHELQQMCIGDIDCEFPIQLWPDMFHNLKTIRSTNLESKHLLKTGGIIPVRMNLNYFRYQEQDYVLGLTYDISAQQEAEARLKLERSRYQSVINSTVDAFWMVDTLGNILEVNDVACRMSGYSRDEMETMHISDLEAIESVGDTNQHIEKIIKKGADLFESVHKCKDGTHYPVEVAVSYSELEGGLFFSLIRNISNRKLDEEINNLHKQLTDLVYVSDVNGILTAALDLTEQLTHSKIGYFHFVDDNAETISLQTWSTRTLHELCSALGEGLHYPVSEAGIWADCIRKKQPVIHNDYATTPDRGELPEGHAPVTRVMSVPVFRENKIVAVLGVGNKHQEYDEHDISIADRIANITFDFAEHTKTKQHIEHMAYHDTLTGLPNRDLFSDRLAQSIAMTNRTDDLLAVCFLDLDGFKPINDRYGHDVGDLLLIELGKRLTELMRESDSIARLGGDEFAILINRIVNQQECEQIVQRVLDAVKEPVIFDENQLSISCTIGVTLYPTDNNNPDTLLRHADQAMYEAKAEGKGQYKLYDIVASQQKSVHLDTYNEVSRAIDSEEFLLYYQPRIDLYSGKVVGAEALIRWNHPEKGILPPNQFLPIIEGTPKEIQLGEWVIKTAIEQFYQWHKNNLRIPVSINISPAHIQQRSFVNYLSETLRNYPEHIAKFIEFEVLETSAIEDIDLVAEVMDDCTQLGVTFSLDDFGTGYSSLTYFRRLPISILKIDQNFVRNMLTNSQDMSIVEGVIQLSKMLKRPVVAEGIETNELGYILMNLGCQYGQGYGISKPMPPENIESWLLSWKAEHEWHDFKRYLMPENEDLELKVAIYIHLLWLRTVKNYLDNVDNAEVPECYDQQSQFTSWYEGIGYTKYGKKESFPFIQVKHIRVHDIADMMVGLIKEGNTSEANNLLSVLISASDDLLDSLHKLQN